MVSKWISIRGLFKWRHWRNLHSTSEFSLHWAICCLFSQTTAKVSFWGNSCCCTSWRATILTCLSFILMKSQVPTECNAAWFLSWYYLEKAKTSWGFTLTLLYFSLHLSIAMPEVQAGEGPVRDFHWYFGFLQLVLSPQQLVAHIKLHQQEKKSA